MFAFPGLCFKILGNNVAKLREELSGALKVLWEGREDELESVGVI